LPFQNVISGDTAAVEKVIHSIGRKYPEATITYLDNGGPWHNPNYMAPASVKVGENLKEVPFSKPKSKLYLPGAGGFVKDPEEIAPALGQEISDKTTFWQNTLDIVGSGIKTFIDAGPHKVMKGFLEKIPNIKIFDRTKIFKKATREIPVVAEKKLEERIREDSLSSPSVDSQEDSQ